MSAGSSENGKIDAADRGGEPQRAKVEMSPPTVDSPVPLGADDAPAVTTPRPGTRRVHPYVAIARPDHWLKNAFMLPGVVLVYFFRPGHWEPSQLWVVAMGFVAACLVASSNYVLNEILDAHSDRHHPLKHRRPVASGRVSVPLAYGEWLGLAIAGLGIGLWISWQFAAAAATLWIMAIAYNVPPLRLKDVPYADVLTESINNPLRMALGWYATRCGSHPTLSVLMTYWMFGAFLMAVKRFAEYQTIGDPDAARRYRRSFAVYNEERLLASIIFYASLFAMFAGIFIARYRIELVLATPVICLAMAHYLHLGFRPDSPAQYPEKLHRAPVLMALVAAAFAISVLLLFIDIPVLQDIFRRWHEWD